MEGGIRVESLEKEAAATLIVGVSGDLIEVARALGRNGEKIGLVSKNSDLLYRYKDRLEEYGVGCSAYVADVTDSQSVLNMLTKFSAWSPRLDRLIYNVGVMSNERAGQVSEGELATAMSANFYGFVNCFQLVQTMFSRLGRGHAVVMSSAAALSPDEHPVANSTSKASLRIFIKALRKELDSKEIIISEVFLGSMRTSAGQRELTCEEIVHGLMHVLREQPDEYLIGQSEIHT